jgi:hypothetical protein|tara:strand:- start:1415 stop:1849 length:435 start_codon:yes stop_codon:yes gene_type:complete
MKSTMLVNSGLLLLGILGIAYILGFRKYKESFLARSVHFSKNMTPGEYPIASTKGILYGDYQQKNNPSGLSDYQSNTGLTLFPDALLGDYSQKTNNIRYWPTPCNGSTIPSAFCGGMYNKKSFDITTAAPPKPDCLRVNYYCSN